MPYLGHLGQNHKTGRGFLKKGLPYDAGDVLCFCAEGTVKNARPSVKFVIGVNLAPIHMQ